MERPYKPRPLRGQQSSPRGFYDARAYHLDRFVPGHVGPAKRSETAAVSKKNSRQCKNSVFPKLLYLQLYHASRRVSIDKESNYMVHMVHSHGEELFAQTAMDGTAAGSDGQQSLYGLDDNDGRLVALFFHFRKLYSNWMIVEKSDLLLLSSQCHISLCL